MQGRTDPFAYPSPGTSAPTPSGPGRPSRPLQGRGSLVLLEQALGRDSGHISVKLVKTTKCHRIVSKRPVIVPICQNGLRKSPLEIPRFPISVAFSHKELMAVLSHGSDFTVKMMKCRQCARTRSGRQIPPVSREQARFCDTSSSDSARAELASFSDILNEARSIRKLGTFGS